MSTPPPAPKRIGSFQLLDRIGEGGMGTVWKARQVTLDRIVALKLLNAEFSTNEEFLTRFRNEARAAANLSHAHIIQVYDAGTADGVNFLAMEYIAGKSVRDLLDAQGQLTEMLALDIVIPVAQASQYAWDRARLIHRDIKPENILIDQDGTVKLGDLGLAKSADTREALKVTRAGQTLGTPHYISPEQAEGKADLDLRTDIYSLGATLYHMVTGHALFEEAPTAAAMAKHLDETVSDAREFQPQLTDGVCMIIEKMLAKKRDDRYAGWQELISDLQLVRAGRRPINARIEPRRSTMKRAEAAGQAGPTPLIYVKPQQSLLTSTMWVGITVIVACLIGMIVIWSMSQQREQELRAELAARQVEAHADAAARAFYEAMEFSRAKPQEFDEIIKRFESVAKKYAATEFAGQASAQIPAWRQRHAAVDQQRQQREIAARAAQETAARQAAATAAAKEADQKKAAEEAKAVAERRRATEEAARIQRAAQAAYTEFVPAWTALLARRDYAGALAAAQKAAADPRLAPLAERLSAHVITSQRLREFTAQLLGASSPLIGKNVALSTIRGQVTAVTTSRGLVVEKVAGVGAIVTPLALPTDDWLRVAAVVLTPGDADSQINYALLLLAEGHVEPARTALEAVGGTAGDNFNKMLAGIAEVKMEIEGAAVIADLRTQMSASGWPAALTRLLLIDAHYTNTTAYVAASNELAAVRDQLLALPPNATTDDLTARLATVEARLAVQSQNWPRAVALFKNMDTRWSAAATPPPSLAALEKELDALRQQLVTDSGLPEAAALADVVRRRAILRAGGRVWVVNVDGSGDAKTLTNALAGVQDGDGIELGPGTHAVYRFDGSSKQNIVLFGRGGTLPVLSDTGLFTAGDTSGFVLGCGSSWRLENVQFQFSSTALRQQGTNVTVNGCAFSRTTGSRRLGAALHAVCNGAWRSSLENCVIVAPSADAVFAEPLVESARYSVEFNQCTFWLPTGSLESTARRSLPRQFALSLRNSVVLASRVTAATWTKQLLTTGFSYTGNNNLLLIGQRESSDTPSLGDESWKLLYPEQDTASVVTPLPSSTLASLRRNLSATGVKDFATPAVFDLRLSTASTGRTLAADKGIAGVRWPAWRWTAFLQNMATAGATVADASDAGEWLPPITPPALTDAQRALAATIPMTALFRGNCRELADGRVELTYNFASPDQLADWRVRAAARETTGTNSFAVSGGVLHKTARDQSALAHRARFAGDVEFQFQTAVNDTNGVVAGLMFFPADQFAAAADVSQGLRLTGRSTSATDVATNLAAQLSATAPLTMTLAAVGSQLTQTVPGTGALALPLPASHASCEVALSADRTLAQFMQVRIAGALDTSWLEAARAQAVLDSGQAAAPAPTNATPQQVLAASRVTVNSLFKGQVKNLGGGKVEWLYDFKTADQGADWQTDTPAAWSTASSRLTRIPKAGQPFWFRGKLRGDFSITWRGQLTTGTRASLAVRYGNDDPPATFVAGVGLPGFGIAHVTADQTLERLATDASATINPAPTPLSFLAWQLGDALKLQLRQRGSELNPARAEVRVMKSDVPITIGLDGDAASQFELTDIHITGVPDPAWLKAEQLRVVIQPTK